MKRALLASVTMRAAPAIPIGRAIRVPRLAGLLESRVAASLALAAGMAAIYAVAARLSLAFVLEPEQVAAVWPPAGIALGGLLLTARPRWPSLLAGIAVATVIANVSAGVTLATSLGYAGANAAEPLLAAMALERLLGRPVAFRRVTDVVKFTLVAVGASSAAAVMGAAAATNLSGTPEDLVSAWLTWWLADAAAILVVTPLVLTSSSIGHHRRWTPARVLELGAIELGVIGFSALVLLDETMVRPSTSYLLLGWAAVRAGLPGTSIVLAQIAIAASAGAVSGVGPFSHPGAPAAGVADAQAFVGIMFFTSYLIGTAVQQLEEARRELEVRRAAEASRAQRLDASLRFARQLAVALDGATFDDRLVEAVRDAVRLDWMVLATLAPDGTWLVTAEHGVPSALGRRIESYPLIARTLESHHLELSVDGDGADVASALGLAAAGAADGSVAALPLVHEGQAVALLLLGPTGPAELFDIEDRRLLELMSDLGALAIRNSRTLADATERSARDSLTGLPNRHFFDVAIAQLAAQRARQVVRQRPSVSVLFFDLDHFGAINKERGHATGDRVLKAFADVLATRLRGEDIVARYGGEEFVAVLSGTDRTAGLRLADEVRAQFANGRIVGADDQPIRCTVSAGVATIESDEEDAAQALARADVGLAMAKRAGRNQVQAA